MKRLWKAMVYGVVLFFGMTVASEAAFQQDERSMPRRVRQELKERKLQERQRKGEVLTPEEKAQKEGRSARIRNRMNKYVINPIKNIRPHRRPGPPNEEAAARRREAMRQKFDGFIPRREGAAASTASGATQTPSRNVQPASYSSETK